MNSGTFLIRICWKITSAGENKGRGQMEGNRRGKGRVHLMISRKERHSFGPSQYKVQSVC